MRDLKPCPFCGCAMRLDEASHSWGSVGEFPMYYLVGDAHELDCLMRMLPAPRSNDRDELVEFWNRRANNEP